ncbi:MAG: tetratricopeptide repeat protein [Gammaproteobacteria bacterium]
MPQDNICKYMLIVVLATIISGCATSPSGPKQSDSEEALPQQTPISNVDSARYDETSELMYEVITGELAGKLGDLEASKQSYSRASELSDDPKVIERAMRIAIFAKDWPLALKIAHRWSEVLDGNIEAQQVLGVLYLRQGDVDSSTKHFSAVMDAASESPSQGYSIIASTLARVENVDASLELMDRLVAKNFTNPYGHLSYANLAMKANKYQLAVDQSELALGFKPDLSEARVLRARALSLIGDHDSAFVEMQTLVDADPQNFDLRLGYARMLLQAEQFNEAGQQFEVLLDQRPNDPDITYMLGLTYVQAEDYEKSKQYFKALIDDNRRLDESNYYLARIYEELGEPENAVKYYQDVAYGDLYLDAAVRLADLYVKENGLEVAREHLNDVRGRVDQPEDVIRLFLAEGHILHDEKLYDQAYELYSQGLLEFPKHPDLLYARALTADYIDRIDLLESDLLVILQSDPDHANALNALGYTLADRGLRIDEAQKYVERAYELKPNDPAVMDSMGWIQFRKGNYAEAESYLRKALDLMDDAEIIGHLGELLWAQGNYEEARNLLREAMDRHSEDSYIQKLIKQFSE